MSTNQEIQNANIAANVATKNDRIENESLKIENTQLKAQLDVASKTIVKLSTKIEEDQRAKLVPVILAATTLQQSDVYAMSLDQMFDTVEHIKILKHSPLAASVRPGADAEAQDGLTVPRKFKYDGKTRGGQ